MFALSRKGLLLGSLLLIATQLSIPSAHAVTVTATGTNPSICDQQVNDATGVVATRLAGGDCLVKFTSTVISYSWTAPANLYGVTYLVVGGGGSGGTGWDTTGSGGGGGGMVLAGNTVITANSTYSITVGAGGAQSTNGRTYYNGYVGSSSTFANLTALGGGFGYTSRANSGVAQSGGLAQVSTTAAPTGGSGAPGGSGGGGGGGAGGAGSAGSGATGGSAGAGISNSITDSALIYGQGGSGASASSTSATGASGAANTGKGGAGGTGGSSSSASGGAGGTGVVMIRYSTTVPAVNSFALSGTPLTAIYRGTTTINLNVTVQSTVTFLANGKRIAGCISIPATGSSSSFATSCPWSPATKGAVALMAQIKPTSPGLASFTSTINISVVSRSGAR